VTTNTTNLDDVLLDLGTTVVLGWTPVNDAVVLEDSVDEDGRRRRRNIHDVDVDQLLVLTLGVLQDHLVDAGLLPLRVDDVELNSVAVDCQLNVLSNLEDLAVLLNVDLEVGLLLTFDLDEISAIFKSKSS